MEPDSPNLERAIVIPSEPIYLCQPCSIPASMLIFISPLGWPSYIHLAAYQKAPKKA